MEPKKAFEDLLDRMMILDWGKRVKNIPGAMVKRMSQPARRALKKLTSEDVLDIRDEDAKAWIEAEKKYKKWNKF